MVKLRQEDMTAASKHLVFDLAHCFVPYLSLESLNSLFGYLTPLLDVSCNYLLQKCASKYHILYVDSIC